MSLQQIQYHCGRLLDAVATNPQTKYHARRITEIAKDDLTLMARRVVEQTTIWWQRTKNSLNF